MYDDLRKQCFELNMRLAASGLVKQTFGNVSVADRERGVMAIKPSGVPYSGLKVEDIPVLSIADGRVRVGKFRPSSDTKTHLVLYRAYPQIGGIVHTHSTFATSWAQAARDVPLYGTTHADCMHVPIPCTDFMEDAKIEGDYEVETGHQIVQIFSRRQLDPGEVQMVLVAGHGPFAWGKTGGSALEHAELLEELCKMAFLTEQLRPDAPPLKDALVKKHYLRKHGPGAYYGQKR
ncbi:MAG: L-ribulose-5-phosphate 4-epimerase AraD [Lentisphaeria bacterium]|nr:L-ribulose-5-phosphate 4-epimerase AraD [Lentisphaeria bacterium]